jgi:holo-[acyl-carrier protein] synthase
MNVAATCVERGAASDSGPVAGRGSPRVGVDLADVAAVRTSLESFGDRFVRRIFTEHETACCRSVHHPSGYDASALAARFAAKEAVLKVLRPRGARPEWRAIEVRRHPDGWCSVLLSGSAAALAAAQGISEISVSLSHEGPVAAAVACAAIREDR